MVHTGRQRGRSRSRVLYWFRTPPGVRVGRSALDEDAIRLIEANNPDLEFDWTSILKGQDTSKEPSAAVQNERRGRSQRTRETVSSRPQQAPPRPSTLDQQGNAPVDRASIVEQIELEQSGHAGSAQTEELSAHGKGSEGHERAELLEEIATPGPSDVLENVEPSRAAELETPFTGSDDLPATAAVARLGAEGVVRLRARHAEVLARISEKITDQAGRDELKVQAERLNPDTWVTAAEVTAGLESYESVFESLRGVVGRRRKRRRPREGRTGSQDQPVPADHSAAEDSAADD